MSWRNYVTGGKEGGREDLVEREGGGRKKGRRGKQTDTYRAGDVETFANDVLHAVGDVYARES